MDACIRQREALVEFLLSRGANVTVANGWGWQALHFAAAGGSDAIAWRLLQAGADVTRPTTGASYQAAPIEIARHYGHDAVVSRLQYALDLRQWAQDGTG